MYKVNEIKFNLPISSLKELSDMMTSVFMK
jgi:hypothetical protein